MQNLEIGIIGAGNISSTVHLPLLSCIENVSVKYIADTFDPKDLAKTYNTQSIKITDITSLPDCDIAVLAIPVGVRKKYIQEFSKRKTAIFTEKPFAIDPETHKSFLELSNRISCNYMRIYYNSTRQIKDIITSRIFGPIKKVSITEGGIIGKTGREKSSYQANPKLSGGGLLMETGCHTLSQLDFLFDNIVVRESKVIWQDDFDIDVQVVFDISGNNSFSIDYHITMIKPVETLTTFFFEHFELSFNHLVPNPVFTISNHNSEEQFTLRQENRFAATFAQAYYLKWKSFLHQITQGDIIDTKFETSFKTTQMISDIIQKGRSI
mgnify:FL=1